MKKLCILTGLFALTLAGPAWANLTLITSRAGLGANDFIDWGQLGVSKTTVSNPFTLVSNDGLTVTGRLPSGRLERRDQGPDWAGNFAPGDEALWTKMAPGPLTLEFSTSTVGVGAQIMRNVYGAFHAIIEAFDSHGTRLCSYTVDGLSNDKADNSAIFIGVLSSTANISRVTFNATSLNGMGDPDFAINQVDLVAVPAPGAMLLAAIGLAIVGKIRRRPN